MSNALHSGDLNLVRLIEMKFASIGSSQVLFRARNLASRKNVDEVPFSIAKWS